MKYITIMIAITGICFLACKSESHHQSDRSTSVEEVGVVKTVAVERYAESALISALGIVMSESEAKPSFKTGGVINKTYVKEGDVVRKGQLLATLIMDEIDAQVRQAEEGLIKAERDKNRVSNLYADSVATLEQYQNATTGYEMARRNAEIARFNRAYSEVRSPISGKIVKQIMRAGEITGPGTPVYAVIGIGSQDWVIKTGLIDRDWARVKIRDKVRITMDAYPGKVFDGYISDKSSVGGSASGTFDVEIKLISQPVNMAAGLTAKVTINTAENDTYNIIPIEALVKTNGNTAYAFTIEHGSARMIPLTIARLLGDKVAVSHGLEGVKEVVTTGAMYLEDGDKIRIQ